MKGNQTMNKNWTSLLDSGTPTLVLAALVLGSGIAYGLYARGQAPVASVEAAPTLSQEIKSISDR